MKNIRIITLLFFAGFVMNSCKKKYPETPPAFSPVFEFTGTVNSSSVNLQAGANDYYMFTSYAPDMNGVYDFIGELRDKNCTSNCSNSLKISIKDYRPYSTNPTSIDSLILLGYYSYASTNGTCSKYYVHFFDTLFNGTTLTYSWNFGDGGTSTSHHPWHLYTHPGVYDVTFSSTSTNSCISTLSNKVLVGQQLGNPLMMAAGCSPVSGNNVSFSASVGGGVGPYTYSWDFGDANTSTIGPSVQHTYSLSGVYSTQLRATDAIGTTSIYNINSFTSTTSTCHCNFYPQYTSQINNPMNLSDVLIEWRDASGVLWTSRDGVQSANSVFKVLAVDNYHFNLSGQPTKKITAKVVTKLYNGTSYIILNGDVTFAIAYPQ